MKILKKEYRGPNGIEVKGGFDDPLFREFLFYFESEFVAAKVCAILVKNFNRSSQIPFIKNKKNAIGITAFGKYKPSTVVAKIEEAIKKL